MDRYFKPNNKYDYNYSNKINYNNAFKNSN